jgi:hypothetical protein
MYPFLEIYIAGVGENPSSTIPNNSNLDYVKVDAGLSYNKIKKRATSPENGHNCPLMGDEKRAQQAEREGHLVSKAALSVLPTPTQGSHLRWNPSILFQRSGWKYPLNLNIPNKHAPNLNRFGVCLALMQPYFLKSLIQPIS